MTLLQYVDDLLLPSATQEKCEQATVNLLRELGRLGYRVSATKAQIAQQEVRYLGYRLKGGQRWLTPEMTETVLRIPQPKSARAVRKFLGSVGYCPMWIPEFAEIAQPLYAASKEALGWGWTETHQKAFDRLKTALLESPALALPDLEKPFFFYVSEAKGIAKAVLVQPLGPWKCQVAYLSKKLDLVVARWPPCLQVIAATSLLVKGAGKLTFGQPLTIIVPHVVERLLRQLPGHWMTNTRLTHYQALLLDTSHMQFMPPTALNPATMLPLLSKEAPLHDCQEILADTMTMRPDLKDTPLSNSNLV